MKAGAAGLRSGARKGFALLLCLALVAGCAGISSRELQSLGSELVKQSVDFAALESDGQRARAAYSKEAAIRAAYPKTVRVATPGRDDVQYFVERDDAARLQYLVVRGTANDKDLKEDVEVRVREDRKMDIPVHSGFDQVASAVYADAVPYLKRDYRTVFIGHSLGGAAAAIIGIYAMEDGYDVERIVTFGQPRFTTAKGVERLTSLPLTRVVDENDIIPMLPPATKLDRTYGPYEHVGPEVILLDGPRYVYLPSHDATRLALGEFWRDMAFADLTDHKMQHYLDRLAAKRSGAIQVAYNDRERYVTAPRTATASRNK